MILDETWKSLDTEFEPKWKDQKKSYQVRQNLLLFGKLVALFLDWNCVKGLILTKTAKSSSKEPGAS